MSVCYVWWYGQSILSAGLQSPPKPLGCIILIRLIHYTIKLNTANHTKRAKTKPVTTYVTKSVTKNVLDVKMLLFIVPSFKLGQAKL